MGKFFMAKSAPTVGIVRLSAELILTSKSDINRRVNKETEIYPSLDIKKTIYPTGIFRVVLMNR